MSNVNDTAKKVEERVERIRHFVNTESITGFPSKQGTDALIERGNYYLDHVIPKLGE